MKKLVDLRKLGRENRIAQTFESHCANWHKSCGIRQNQREPHSITYLKGKYFLEAKTFYYVPFNRKELTNGVDLREAGTIVVDSDPGSDLLLTSYAI